MGIFLITALRVALTALTVISVSILVTTEISSHQPPFDPFAPYADILPGQPRDAVIQRGFHCQFYNPPFYSYERCTLNPHERAFSKIEVDIASDTGSITRLSFTLRPAVLTIGNLILLWGQPEVKVFGKNSNLHWNKQHIVAVPQHYRPHFPYLYSVDYVAFESTD